MDRTVTVSPTSTIEVLDHAVLRCALWPIETVELFSVPDLAKLADGLLEVERVLAARRDALLPELEDLVPVLADRRARAWALQARRRLYATAHADVELPEQLLDALKQAAPAVVAGVRELGIRRREWSTRWHEFEERFAVAMREQRATLREATADVRFGRALALANRGILTRWERLAAAGLLPERARDQRLEATVFHFLMRAAGRATPHGAWAGVVPIDPRADGARISGSEPRDLDLAPSPGRVSVTLDLAPFLAIVESLARHDRYRWGSAVRLQAGAHRVEGCWWYERDTGGGAEWCVLPDHPLAAAVLEVFGDRQTRHVGPVVDELAALAEHEAQTRADLIETVATLFELGVLQTTLRLPAAPTSVMEGLRAVGRQLVEQDRERWLRAIKVVTELCDDLGNRFEHLEPREVAATVEDIERALCELLGDFGLDPRVRGPVVHVDVRLPLSGTWSDSLVARVRMAVREVLGFHMAEGVAECARLDSVERLHVAMSSLGPVPLHHVLRAAASSPLAATPGDRWTRQLGERQQFWTATLTDQRSAASVALPLTAVDPRPVAGPFGSFLFSLDGTGALRAEWGRPQPGIFVTRLGQLLDGPDGDSAGLVVEFAEHVARWTSDGLSPVEIVGADPANPNAAVRPGTAARALNPHVDGDLRVCDLAVVSVHDRPWLRTADRPEHLLLPMCTSAALIGTHDPCSRTLFELAMAHGWELTTVERIRLAEEGSAWEHLPQLRLPGGTVLAPERWWLGSETVAAIASERGATQFLAWRRQVVELQLPGLVWVGFVANPDEPRLVVRTDSPLAIHCLFLRLRRSPGGLVIVAPHGDPTNWPVGSDEDRHYVAELAVGWYDDEYGPTVHRHPNRRPTEGTDSNGATRA